MTRIFYFTGTGNSLKIALDLKALISNSEVVAIKNAIKEKDYLLEADIVGFVFPIYYYGLPWIVERFINTLELKSTNYIFAVASAMFPSGIALSTMNSILTAKGRQLSYGSYIKMPTNFVTSLNTLPERKMINVLDKAEHKTKEIANDIITRRNFVKSEGKLFNLIVNAKTEHAKWQERVHDTDKKFVISDSCNGCGICESVCPVSNIERQNKKPCFKHQCEQCYSCINLCPQKAIGYAKMKSGRYKHPQISLDQIIGSK